MPDPIGPYELLSRLGAGAMGTVWRARDTRTGGILALKILDSRYDEHDPVVRKFEQEVDLARSFRHENIVRAYDAGVIDGQRYMTMDLIDGETLADRIKRDAPLPEEYVRELGIAVASALEVSHAAHVVHRDIKPGNILLGRDGSIKVSDFGIARLLDNPDGTRTMTFIGGLAFAAPETFDGRADERSDLYSLGVVLYQALTGALPFEGLSERQYVRLHAMAPPDLAPVRKRSPALAPTIERLLRKTPRERFQSAREVRMALESGRPQQAATAVGPERTLRVSEIEETRPAAASGGGSPRTPPAVNANRPRGAGSPSRRLVIAGGIGMIAAAGLAFGLGWYLFSSGNGGEDDLSSQVSASELETATAAAAPTATPPIVPGFGEQALLTYGEDTLTVSVDCFGGVSGPGLQAVESLDPATGVLFNLPENEPIPAWGAPGYSFGIDAIFLNDEKVVTAVFADIPPDGIPANSATPVRYAIELNVGDAERRGITTGTAFTFDDVCV